MNAFGDPVRPSLQVTHQRVVLELDFARQCVLGYTDLTVRPLTDQLSEVRLHCRQAHVSEVRVEEEATSFVLDNPYEDIVKDEHEHSLDAYYPEHDEAIRIGELGELLVRLPAGFAITQRVRASVGDTPIGGDDEDDDEDGGGVDDVNVGAGDGSNGNGNSNSASAAGGDAPAEEGAKKASAATKVDYHPFVIRVFFELVRPRAGMHFVIPTRDSVGPQKHAHFYTAIGPTNARLLFPCIDTLTDRCVFELELTAPENMLVVSSGELQQQVLSEDESKKTFYYSLSVPTLPGDLSIAAGPFEVLPDPLQQRMTHFCLPGLLPELQYSTSVLSHAWSFFEEYLGTKMPYESYKQAFVAEPWADAVPGAGNALLATHLLHNEDVIDQTVRTRMHQVYMLAYQWFGCYLGAQSWADHWLLVGLTGFLAEKFRHRLLGANTYMYRVYKDKEYVVKHDIHNQPLYARHLSRHPEELNSKFFRKKAHLVLFMIERRIGAEMFRKVLSKLTTPSVQTRAYGLSTAHFLILVQKLTGHDLTPFARQWIYGSGCIHLRCGFWFNRKKQRTEFALHQSATHSSSVGLFSGPITIRINELDGTYDHVVHIDSEYHQFDFPCHSKHRRLRKKTFRFENGEVLEIEMPRTNDTPLLWIRVDPDFEWLFTCEFRKPEFMWIHQLQLDRDVVAQCEAVAALQSFSTSMVSLRELIGVVENDRFYYCVRVAAALSVGKCCNPETGWAGLDALLKYYKSNFFLPDSNMLRPLDFSDFALYFVRMAVVESLASVKDVKGNSPSDVVSFLIDLLRQNDNSLNAYSDAILTPFSFSHYLSCVLRSIVKTNSTSSEVTARIVKQLRRYLDFDVVIKPSFDNIITQTCLDALTTIHVAKGVVPDLPDLIDKYLGREYHAPVRVRALAALLRTGYVDRVVWQRVLELMRDEPQPQTQVQFMELMTSPPEGVKDAHFFAVLQGDASMCRTLWQMMNHGSSHDWRIRLGLMRLYHILWGRDPPACLSGAGSQSTMLHAREAALRKAPVLSLKLPETIDEAEQRRINRAAAKNKTKLKLKISLKQPGSDVSSAPTSAASSVPPVPTPTALAALLPGAADPPAAPGDAATAVGEKRKHDGTEEGPLPKIPKLKLKLSMPPS